MIWFPGNFLEHQHCFTQSYSVLWWTELPALRCDGLKVVVCVKGDKSCLSAPGLSCGEGEELGCSMWKCLLSCARALQVQLLRNHRGCFWICWAEPTLLVVLLAKERLGQKISCEHKHSQGSGFRQVSLFQRRNRHTLSPHGLLDVWRAFGEVCGLCFVCYFIPCCGVWAEDGGSCFPVLQAGSDPRLSWASRAESSWILTQNSKHINYFLWLFISGPFLSRTCKLRLLFSWQRSIKGKGNASITRGCVAVGFENQILLWRSMRCSHCLFQTPSPKV